MPYQIAATAVTLNDLEGRLQVAGLFKWNCTISTDSVFALRSRSALAELLV